MCARTGSDAGTLHTSELQNVAPHPAQPTAESFYMIPEREAPRLPEQLIRFTFVSLRLLVSSIAETEAELNERIKSRKSRATHETVLQPEDPHSGCH